MQKIRIENLDRRSSWSAVRELFVLLLWSAILVAAAFGWGMIYENRRHDYLKKESIVLNEKVRDLSGRLTAMEGPQSKTKR